MDRKRRILFFGEGITMTHFTRPAVLAQVLDAAAYDISFWTPKRYHHLLSQNFSRLGELRTIDPAAFLKSLANGRVLYGRETLREYVKDDLAIIDEVRPDLIIGDFRMSLSISAPLRGVPFATVFNAQWSPYRRQPAIVPELPLTRWLPPRLLSPIFSAIRPAIYAAHARPVNELRCEFGLPRISDDLRKIYTSGDLMLYPDVPEFTPLSGAPAHHHFIGPCLWSPPATKPAWWNEVMRSPRPKVFVSLGSSGPVKALPAVLEAAARLPVDVILATSGRYSLAGHPHVFSAELLPYEQTARNCAFVVSHGGTGGLYATLCAGAPMLAIPNNIDNHLSSALLEDNGAGLSVRVESASVKTLLPAMERLLSERSFTEAAEGCAKTFARYDTAKLFPQLVDNWFAGREAQAPKSRGELALT